MSSAWATAFGAIVGAVSVRPAVLAGLGKARAGWRGAVVGLLVVVGARVARTEVEAAVTIGLISSGSGGETSGQIKDGGGLSGVGDAQVGHLGVEMREGIGIRGES